MAGDYQYYRIEKKLSEIEDLLSEVLRRLGNMEYKGQIKYGTPNMVSDDHFKYVHMTALPPLLFDLENDPEEFVNLASHPDFQKVVVEYSGKMLSWNMLHRDRTLVNMNMESGTMAHWKGPRVFDPPNR